MRVKFYNYSKISLVTLLELTAVVGHLILRFFLQDKVLFSNDFYKLYIFQSGRGDYLTIVNVREGLEGRVT